jgi:hypothetical protein
MGHCAAASWPTSHVMLDRPGEQVAGRLLRAESLATAPVGDPLPLDDLGCRVCGGAIICRRASASVVGGWLGGRGGCVGPRY